MIALILSWICIGWLSLVLGVATIRALKPLIGRAKEETLTIAPDYTLLFGFAISTFLVSLTSLIYRINWEVNILSVMCLMSLFNWLYRMTLSFSLQRIGIFHVPPIRSMANSTGL